MKIQTHKKILFFFLSSVRVELRALCLLARCSTPESHLQPFLVWLFLIQGLNFCPNFPDCDPILYFPP
jgi:hypothetical protein